MIPTALRVMSSALLVAGTKFRVRDATASLDGAVDWQVLLELGLFACIGAGLIVIWLAGGQRPRATTGERAVAAYVAVALLSAAWSAAPMMSLVRGAQLLIVAGLAIVASRVLSPQRALWFAVVAVSVHVLVCSMLALVIPAADGVTAYDDPDRFRWFAVHPIDAGSLAALGALGMLAAALFAPAGCTVRVAGVPASALAIALSVVLIMASTRSALLSFVGGAGVLAMLRLHGTIRWPLMMTAAAGLLLVAAAAPNLEATLHAASREYPVLDKVFFRGQDATTVLEMNGRLELWSDLRPAIEARLLTGYGYQASREVLLATAFWAAYAHNAYLQTLVDLGVAGAVALLGVVTLCVRGMARVDLGPWTQATVGAFAAFLLVNAVSTESFAAAPGFDALALFLCATCGGAGDRP